MNTYTVSIVKTENGVETDRFVGSLTSASSPAKINEDFKLTFDVTGVNTASAEFNAKNIDNKALAVINALTDIGMLAGDIVNLISTDEDEVVEALTSAGESN